MLHNEWFWVSVGLVGILVGLWFVLRKVAAGIAEVLKAFTQR